MGVGKNCAWFRTWELARESRSHLRISTYSISPEKEKNSFMFSAVAERGTFVTLIVLT
jgi:Holliday junction resolvasome RuvABC DNA-binding subunit